MKNLLFMFIACLLTVVITGCTKKQDGNLKVLHLAVTSKVKGMDPIYANDLYSNTEVARVYEGLLEYHYLKRPYTLIPNLATEMPKVSADGLTYTFKIKQGVLFQDNKCFPAGRGRELIAKDFVYSIKRLADPKLQSLGWWLIDGKISGLNQWRDKHVKTKETNYDEVIEGVKVLDRYTLQFKLSKSFPQFLYALAMPFTFAVPKEAVFFYKKEFVNHPVGTGPFKLDEFKQTNKIVYYKNPTFRDKFYPKEASPEFAAKGYLADAGKKLPLVDKLVVNIMVESQPRWLNFQKGRLDFITIPKDNFDTAITPGKGLSPSFIEKGISLDITPALDVTYIAFNHDNELFKNVKLRRAMSLAYNITASNKLFYNDTALPAQSIVPPGIAGYLPGYVSPYRGLELEKAKNLLAEAGYPGGKGLPVITYDTTASTISRQMSEFFKKQMAKIGIEVKAQSNSWPELQKKVQTTRELMMWGIAWGADYPDAENFLQLLYGPNKAPGSNGSGYSNKDFDKLFEKTAVMQDSPERTKLYEKMNKMVAEEVPIIYGVHRQNYTLKQTWMKNFVASDFDAGRSQYLNVDKATKSKVIKTKF